MSEYIDTLNINDVDYDIKDSGALHQSDVAAVATSGSYSDLSNKPSINNVTLSGNKTAAQLGLQETLTIDATPTEDSTNPVQSGGVFTALANLIANNALFGGYVEPNDEPTYGDDHRYYYLAATEGRYTHFYNFVVDGYIAMFLWNESTQHWRMLTLWHNDQTVDEWLQGKANIVYNATDGNLAGLDEEGNLTDSGIAASAVATTSDLAGKQDTISDLSTIRSGAELGATAIQSSEKGAASGVATLDSGGKVPQSQLPSYVDDVLEYANLASFPATGESGKIYVALDTNKTYRWSGSAYVEISESLALGETSSTAFAGDRGKAIEDKIPSTASSSNKLATASDVNGKLSAPSTAGTSGQVLTSDGQGGQSWQTPTSAVSDVTVGGTSVVTNGVAAVPAIPTVPTISTNVATDKADNTKTTGAKAVYDEVHPPLASTMPSGGFLPNIEYNLGTLNADITFLMAAATDNTIGNIWYWVFETPSTTLNITFPSAIEWNGGNPPTIDPSKHYEITVKYNVGAFIVTDIPS